VSRAECVDLNDAAACRVRHRTVEPGLRVHGELQLESRLIRAMGQNFTPIAFDKECVTVDRQDVDVAEVFRTVRIEVAFVERFSHSTCEALAKTRSPLA
jgi:hypothetical protein